MSTQKAYIENNELEATLEAYLDRLSPVETESVPTTQAAGRVTAKAVYARLCDPVYNAAAMDGISVLSQNTVGASESSPLVLELGKDFEYVNTGNPLPEGRDSVIMIENVVADTRERVRITAPSAPWQNVRMVGESVVASELVIPKNRIVRPVEVGAILASGNDEITLRRRPRLGVIPTGAELVESGDEVKYGTLRETNTRVFVAVATEFGAKVTRYGVVNDDSDALEAAISSAVRDNDIVVVNAGSSAGSKDYVADIIAKLGEVFAHGLAIKPGKPTILGLIDGKPVIGVPGYPVSAYLVFDRVVLEALRKLVGLPIQKKQTVSAILTKRVTSTPKNAEFVRVAMGIVNDKLVASPLERGAAAIMGMVKADGLMLIPRLREGYEAGDEVFVELQRPLEEIKQNLLIVGSHDMIIDVVGDELRVSSSHVGSLSGIIALKRGAAHLAPIHLLDGQSGTYNIPAAKKYFPDGDAAIIRGVTRIQGIFVPHGNPKKILSVEDIAKDDRMFANRQGGSGTRVLFDHLLRESGITADKILGYDKEFTTHLAVAMAVKSGTFDCGLGVFSAAKTIGLDFLPVSDESYDFLVRRTSLDDPRIKRFIEVLTSESFRQKLCELGGYGCEHTGEIIEL